MPWSIGDVEKHNKGLSDKQKDQWVKVANSSLKSCMAKGGSEETCAAKAIRTANGVVRNEENYSVHSIKAEGYTTILRNLDGKVHIVVPVVMMVEGVHNGSNGPIFHSIDELGKVPEAWNGIPIMIDHPQVEGVYVSANDPDIIEKAVGKVFYTHVKDQTKLAAQAWIDEEKLASLNADLLQHIKDGKPIEVSVGVFSDNEPTEGKWKEETYSATAKNHRPDHLALLPDSVGACSLNDGCGIRVNKKGGSNVLEIKDDLKKVVNAGYGVSLITNELGFSGVMEKLSQLVSNMDSSNNYHYIVDVFPDSFVYEKRVYQEGKSSVQMFRQAYKIKTDESIELVGDPSKVRREVNYLVNLKKEVNIMANEIAPCIKKKVDTLITQGRFAEEDREALQVLSEAVLDKISKPVIETKEVEKIVEKIVKEEVQVNLSAEDQAALAFGKKELETQRGNLIKGILTNSKDVWTEELLKSRDLDELKRIHKTTGTVIVDYSLNGGNPPIQANADVPLLMPAGFEVENKEKK